MGLFSYRKKKSSFMPRAALGMISVYSISGIKGSFVLGSNIILYFGESFFKMLNFLNMLSKKFQGWIIQISLIVTMFPSFC